MSPAELLADHQAKPRNIGKLMNANATGDVGSIVVGDALRFYIQVKDERITAAKFQVFNCQDQVGASSALSEMVVGLTLDEAEALGPAQVVAHLAGVDPTQLPARLWALEGLRSAIAAYRGEERDADVELEALLCRCHGIPVATVRDSIAVMGLKEVQEVVDATGAGTACGSCRADIPALLSEATAKKAEPATPVRKPGAGGRIAVVHRINALVDGEVRPSLREAGVELELLDLDGAQVVVKVTAGDDTSRRNALATLEKLLKQQVDVGLSVKEA